MKTTKSRTGRRRPQQRSRGVRIHCDQCTRRLQKARKLSDGKLWRLLARMPHIDAARRVAEVMYDRGLLTKVRVVRGTLRVLPADGNMRRAWPAG